MALISPANPLFPINNQRYASLGESCRAGVAVGSVDSGGTMRRCPSVREPIGTHYSAECASALAE